MQRISVYLWLSREPSEKETCCLFYINMHSVCVNTVNINKMHLSLPFSLTVLDLIYKLVVVVTVTVVLAFVVSVLILTVWLSVSVLHCCEVYIELCTVELLVKLCKSLSCLFCWLTFLLTLTTNISCAYLHTPLSFFHITASLHLHIVLSVHLCLVTHLHLILDSDLHHLFFTS